MPGSPSPQLLTTVHDLPDSVLAHVFKHLPDTLRDKFSVSATCWRFNRLVADKRLVVCPPGQQLAREVPGRARAVFPTLAAAVAASRPGDTIWLAPGEHEATNLVLPWPLHLLGGGARPADTWIVAADGDATECALSFGCSGKVAMLGVRCESSAPAVIHVHGSLTLQHCVLVSEPGGLPHLVSPLLTLAVSVAGSAGASSAAGGQEANTAGATSSPLGSHGGRVQVVECQLMGGATAVRCAGTGRPTNVRALYGSHSTAPHLWLDVDSAVPGDAAAAAHSTAPGALLQQQQQQGGAAGPACADEALHQRSKLWQQQRESDARCPAAAGLARISAVLGQHRINPASLNAHLQAREQQQAQQQPGA